MKTLIMDESTFLWIRDIRRTIHEWPETGYEEYRTMEVICKALKELGLPLRDRVAGTGVVGCLEAQKGLLPTIALRADMDALPVCEATGLSFSSKVEGKMHACGHDGHVAMVLGAAALLAAHPPKAKVSFIFQPAEETSGGAAPMIAEGALDGVDVIYGGHIEVLYPAGAIAMRRGVNTAYTTGFTIDIHGKGGHAARPHETIDALVLACQIVLQMQTILTRTVDPLAPAVITIGKMRAGTAHNAVAETASLSGTIRTVEDHVRVQIMKSIEAITSSYAAMSGARVEVIFEQGYPPVINHDVPYDLALETAQALLGPHHVHENIPLRLGGEDFAFFTEKVPGCFVRFGAAKQGERPAPEHSPRFDFDEEVLRIGATFYANLVHHTALRWNQAIRRH